MGEDLDEGASWRGHGCLLGAIAGDVMGSRFELDPTKETQFDLVHHDCVFTDDTVLTLALAETLLHGGDANAYAKNMRAYYRRYPRAGYGERFATWAAGDGGPYGSWGNGSAMRTAPVGWWFATMEQTLAAARAFAAVTHDHPEGIKGAQATAAAVFLARTGSGKENIAECVQSQFGYDLDRTVSDIRRDYDFELSCEKTVPEAIVCFLESTGVNDAIRLSISLGGDADTLACICGGIASAFYRQQQSTDHWVLRQLDADLRSVLQRFEEAVHAR